MESRLVRVLVSASCFGAACCALLSAQAPANPAKECTFEGRAIDEEGKPMRGAAVEVFALGVFFDTAALLASPRTTTDADGRYRIAAGVDRDQQVVVAAKGRQVCVVRASMGVKAERTLPDALLLPGASLTGRVRDAGGVPVAGARIRVADPIATAGATQVVFASGALTDAKGIFVVPGVPSTGLHVIVSAPGWFEHSCFAAQDSPLDVTLARAGFVRGRVVDEQGAAIAGLRLNAVTVATREGDNEPVVSDAEGRFVLSVPVAGRFRIAGGEAVPPYRQFVSTLLHGPADDVAVVPRPRLQEQRIVTVRCIDAATKAAIPQFHASWQEATEATAQVAMLGHLGARRTCRDSARFEVTPTEWAGHGVIVVDAVGHGFEVRAVPNDLTEPLVIALGPEFFLSGRVVDEETNEPMAGVAVRALPNGTARSGAGDPRREGVLTDARGSYRLGGLRPGDYGVQVFGEDRSTSRVAHVQIVTATEATLDLVVPKRRWLELALTGELAVGTAGQLSFRATGSNGSGNPLVDVPPPICIGRERTFKIGPVDNDDFQLELWQPSRVRLGAGTAFDLGSIDPDQGPIAIALPDLACVLVHGRVVLPPDVPTERIAVVAQRVEKAPKRRDRWLLRPQPQVAGLGSDARFVLDLPVGAWFLQLADLETGVMFHTDATDREIGPTTKPIELVPHVHWLDLELTAATAGGEVAVQSFALELQRPQGDNRHAFLANWVRSGEWSRGGELERINVPFRSGATKQRWLVPAGQILVTALQSFAVLQSWPDAAQRRVVDSAVIDVCEPVHRVRLTIPAPPSDEELLRRPAK